MASNNIVSTFRTSVAGRQPNTTAGSVAANGQYISAGQLALNMPDQILYTSDGTNLIYVGANQVNFSVTNSLSFGAKLTVNTTALYVNSAIYLGGSNGQPGQVLTSNGTSNVYWSTITGGGGSVNTANQYTFTNTEFFANSLQVLGNTTQNTIIANGYIQTTNGLYITNSWSGTYTDGVVIDYLQVASNGVVRISGGANDDIQFFNNGPNNSLLASISGNTGSLSIASVAAFANAKIIVGNSAVNTVVNSSSVVTTNGYHQSQFVLNTTQTGTAYTLANSDSGTVIQTTNTSPVTITVPATWVANSRVLITQLGTGAVTIANAAGVNLGSRTGAYTIGNQYGTVSVYMANSTLAVVDGNLTNTSVLVTSVNVAAQYAWTNTQTFSNAITFSGNLVINTTAVVWVGNSTTSPTVSIANTGAVALGNSTSTATTLNLTLANTIGTLTITPSVINVSSNAASFIYLGNTTVTSVINSSAHVFGNSIATTTGTGGIIINTTTPASANIFVGNNTINTYINSTAHMIGNTTTGTGGALLSATTAANAFIFVGNNTVNTYANATYLKLGVSNVITTTTTANGYTTLTNGLIMQWGSLTTANSTAQVVTFATATGKAFASNGVFGSVTSMTSGTTPYMTTINSTAMSIITSSATAATVHWMALGV